MYIKLFTYSHLLSYVQPQNPNPKPHLFPLHLPYLDFLSPLIHFPFTFIFSIILDSVYNRIP